MVGASALAIKQGRLRRVVGVAIGSGNLAVAALTGLNFVTLSPGGAATGDALANLLRSGGVGAKVMFLGGWLGALLGALAVLRPERGTPD